MMRRSRAREVVLQMLYQYDLNPAHDGANDDAFLASRLHNDEALVEFAKGLLNGVRRNREELDAIVTKHAANWTMLRMAATDRNVLRLGAFEIFYSDTPGRVAINEAVELAKRFGTKQSSQFVNGILDGMLPDVDKPSKKAKSSKAKDDAVTDKSNDSVPSGEIASSNDSASSDDNSPKHSGPADDSEIKTVE